LRISQTNFRITEIDIDFLTFAIEYSGLAKDFVLCTLHGSSIVWMDMIALADMYGLVMHQSGARRDKVIGSTLVGN